VFVVASSQFLANPFARASNPTGAARTLLSQAKPSPDAEKLAQLAAPYAQDQLTSTILVFKNTIDWMTGDAVSACALPAKNRQ
jgi:hypothetical protein